MGDEDTVESLRAKLEEHVAEFEDFQNDSAELEKELESELNESRSAHEQLRNQHDRLRDQHDRLAKNLSQLQSEHETLSKSLSRKTEEHQATVLQLRHLEQENDAACQGRRAADSEADHLRAKLNDALERAVLAEEELSELRRLSMEQEQRYKESVRDMEGELQRLAKLTERPKREEVDANEQDENVKKRRSLHITEHEDEQEAVRYGQPPDADDTGIMDPTFGDVCSFFCLWCGLLCGFTRPRQSERRSLLRDT